MKTWIAVASGMLVFAVLSASTMAQRSQQGKTLVGTVVGVYLKLSPRAADMHAMEVRPADGMEMPLWLYDKKDKNLGSFKKEDVVEIRYVTVPDDHPIRKERNMIVEIRKASADAIAAATAPKPAPVIKTDYSGLKACVESGDLAKGRAMVEEMVKAEGGYRLFGDKLRHSGIHPLAQYCYTKAIGDGKPPREAAYTARKSLVLLFQGDYHPDLKKIADGTYKGSCVGYSGPNNVTVTVKDHKITNVSVQSPDSRPLTSLQAVPAAIVSKQGIRDVDAVTGATITSHAVMVGACVALKEAEK